MYLFFNHLPSISTMSSFTCRHGSIIQTFQLSFTSPQNDLEQMSIGRSVAALPYNNFIHYLNITNVSISSIGFVSSGGMSKCLKVITCISYVWAFATCEPLLRVSLCYLWVCNTLSPYQQVFLCLNCHILINLFFYCLPVNMLLDFSHMISYN